jgi:hypothetical protein
MTRGIRFGLLGKQDFSSIVFPHHLKPKFTQAPMLCMPTVRSDILW